MSNNPIFCAIDTSDINKAKELAVSIKPYVGGIKLGLEFFTSCGISGIKQIEDLGLPLFIDLKFYDIPNTVTSALKNILEINPMFTTIHCTGGRKMMTECTNLKKEMNSTTNIIGVTMLTSFDDQEINEIGFKDSVPGSINKLAGLANDCGLDGLVCSPLEAKEIKSNFPELKLIVPGIRRSSDETNDQKRTLSANEAIINGADILVIGRPITESADPAKAAEELSNEIQ